MILYDTLRLRNRLIQGGFNDQQAETIAAALAEADTVELATRSDVEEVRSDIARMEVRLMRWTLACAGIGGLVGGLIAAVVKLF